MSNQAADRPEPAEPPVFSDGHGGSITILEEGSATTPMRYRMALPRGFGPPPEHHPRQEEHFRVISGVLDLGYVDGKRVALRAGETYVLPAGTTHHPMSNQVEPVVFEATLTPGLASAAMFRSIYATMRTQHGVGLAMRMAMVVERHRAEIRFALPVRILLRLLARAARLLDVRAD